MSGFYFVLTQLKTKGGSQNPYFWVFYLSNINNVMVFEFNCLSIVELK